MRYPQAGKEEMCARCCQPKAHINWNGHRADILFDDRTIRLRAPLREDIPKMTCREMFYKGNTAQFPPDGLSTAPAAAARHLRCQNAR